MTIFNLFRRLSRIRSRRPKTRQESSRRLFLETLEDRSVPTANASGILTGVAFIDHNNNGVFDAKTEIALRGVSVTLTGETNQGAAVDTSAITNASGAFTFLNVLPGTYQVTTGAVPSLLGGGGSINWLNAQAGVNVGGGQTVGQNVSFLGLAPDFVTGRQFLGSTMSTDFADLNMGAGAGSGLANFRSNSSPFLMTALANISLAINSGASNIDLAGYFSDPDISNTGNTMTFNTSDGPLNVTLFDKTAPQTVANFLDYVESGAFDNSIFTRLVPGFVLQGGGAALGTDAMGGTTLVPIPTLPTVANEFSIPNTLGTLAMAQSAGNPNSATNQYFFNIANNSAGTPNDLDKSKFTVFAQVATPTDQTALNTLAATPNANESAKVAVPSVDLNNVPLKGYSGTKFPTDAKASNFLVISSITVSLNEVLKYSVVANSNPSLVTAGIKDERLNLSQATGKTGSATITVRATDQYGATNDATFTVTVHP